MSEYTDSKSIYKKDPGVTLGIQAAATWVNDPKRLGFVLSRYKFVSKMLSGKGKVLEIGAGDAWASRIVKQQVGRLHCIDIDSDFVSNGNAIMSDNWKVSLEIHDILVPYRQREYDAAFALDVFEHIPSSDSEKFLQNISDCVKDFGVVIIGAPTLVSQQFSKPNNGHVNCMNGPEFRKVFEKFFENVFIFSMNDEIVHTGMFEMSNYLFALCTSKKKNVREEI